MWKRAFPTRIYKISIIEPGFEEYKGFVLKLSFGFRNIAIVRQRHPLSRLITQRTRIKSLFVFSFEHAFMPDLFAFIARCSNLWLAISSKKEWWCNENDERRKIYFSSPRKYSGSKHSIFREFTWGKKEKKEKKNFLKNYFFPSNLYIESENCVLAYFHFEIIFLLIFY